METIYYELTINEEKRFKNFRNKKVKKIDAIKNNQCFRCGNKELFIFSNNVYCNNCKEFGIVNKGSYFYQLEIEKYNFEYEDKLNKLRLTNRQVLASKFIFSNIIMKSDCLIHAVCGAGKTEITFPSISSVLKNNKFVCFAIPRIDILYEVYERLKEYFPKTKICILNSKEKSVQHGQLYVMTTNQIIKFKGAFDLIIVDEIDAFPFESNIKYDYGVQNAKTKCGSVIYLTSTPSEKFLEKKINKFTIKRRWHNNLLPVPKLYYFDINEFLQLSNYNFINYLKRGRSVLLFVCNIKLGYKVLNKIKEEDINVFFVHSKENKRREIINNFKSGYFNVLLSTPILERGVTFKDIDVVILDADNELYTKASLIQIAGRVNRNKNYQKGEVIFLFKNKTKNINEAKKDIINLNK